MADSAPAEVEAASEALALLRLESAGSGEAPCSVRAERGGAERGSAAAVPAASLGLTAPCRPAEERPSEAEALGAGVGGAAAAAAAGEGAEQSAATRGPRWGGAGCGAGVGRVGQGCPPRCAPQEPPGSAAGPWRRSGSWKPARRARGSAWTSAWPTA